LVNSEPFLFVFEVFLTEGLNVELFLGALLFFLGGFSFETFPFRAKEKGFPHFVQKLLDSRFSNKQFGHFICLVSPDYHLKSIPLEETKEIAFCDESQGEKSQPYFPRVKSYSCSII